MTDKYKHVPAELKEVKQWVGYFTKPRADGGKNKYPVNPKTLTAAKCNDPTTWGTVEEAIASLGKIGQTRVQEGHEWKTLLGPLEGIGLELANGICGVDIDHAITDGEPSRTLLDIVETMDSYTELSPSGEGVHVLFKGEIPEGRNKYNDVEMYQKGRFFTVTGNVFGMLKPLNERTAPAKKVHTKYLAEAEKATTQEKVTAPAIPTSLSDVELLRKAMNAKNGDRFKALWSGDISGNNGDHSGADMALCNLLAYWTNGDAYRIDDLFRQSGLIREKWDRKTGNTTYGKMTIDAVLSDFIPYVGETHSEVFNLHSDEKMTPSAATPGAVNKNESFTELYQSELDKTISLDPQPDVISRYLEEKFTADIERFKTFKGRKTGFYNLDAESGGLYPGLYAIGAISSLGKTTFTHQIGDQLAEQGDHVLFFSLEQNRLEMVTKSLSRRSARIDRKNAVSAIDIRSGNISDAVGLAMEAYSETAKLMNVIECNFDTTIDSIVTYTKRYMKQNNVKPIVIVDYLQIIPATNPHQSDKEKVDTIVRGLKKLQSENDLVVFVISSLNRANYLAPVDFESFKESGSIEYTADVVWGLQLQALNSDIFNGDKKIKEKREKIKIAKKAIPRKLELVCLKNRYGISSYTCGFTYDPRYDLFEPDTAYKQENELNLNEKGMNYNGNTYEVTKRK